jgi:hypothetical protein
VERIVRASMRYDSYRKGLRNLREILLKEKNDKDILGHFGRFTINIENQRGRRSKAFDGIWNAKTNNIVAIKNRKGTVFVRKNSIYAGQLLGSTHKVIASEDLKKYRDKVPSSLKRNVTTLMFADKLYGKLVNNKDVPGSVQLVKLESEVNIDFNYMTSILQDRFKGDKNFPNTFRSLNRPELTDRRDEATDTRAVYITIGDYAEEVAKAQRLYDVKRTIIEWVIDNHQEYVDNSIINGSLRANPSLVRYDVNGYRYEGILTGGAIQALQEGRYDIDTAINHMELTELVEGQQSLYARVMGYQRNEQPMYRVSDYDRYRDIRYAPGSVNFIPSVPVEYFYGATTASTASRPLSVSALEAATAMLSENESSYDYEAIVRAGWIDNGNAVQDFPQEYDTTEDTTTFPAEASDMMPF